MAKVRIPTPLRKYTQGAEEVPVSGATVRAVVSDIESRYPGIRERICDDHGNVRRFVNIYVNGDDIRFLSNLDTPVKEGDEVSIVPAIAGGAAGAADQAVHRRREERPVDVRTAARPAGTRGQEAPGREDSRREERPVDVLE